LGDSHAVVPENRSKNCLYTELAQIGGGHRSRPMGARQLQLARMRASRLIRSPHPVERLQLALRLDRKALPVRRLQLGRKLTLVNRLHLAPKALLRRRAHRGIRNSLVTGELTATYCLRPLDVQERRLTLSDDLRRPPPGQHWRLSHAAHDQMIVQSQGEV
jgi:hypothetical protein